MANGHKTCAKCKTLLPLESFGTHARPNRIVGKRYVNSHCRTCHNSMESREVTRNRRLKSRYGMTLKEFDAKLEAQNGCAVCGSTEPNGKYWHVDHDHACCPTNAKSCGECVRGILCHSCNTALGNARDSVEILNKMISYLSKEGVQYAQ